MAGAQPARPEGRRVGHVFRASRHQSTGACMLAYLDCFSGISGDMLLGALLDAGLDLDALRAGLATLPLAGYTLTAERVSDHGISGTRVRVTLDASVLDAS